MVKLVLVEVAIHPYQFNTACAYIYYGSKESLQDHQGQPINMFSDLPSDLINHLQENVLPKLNKHLEKTPYLAREVDVVNQAPHPFISIQHKNGRVLSGSDVNSISNHLKNAISLINQQVNQNNHKLFTKNPGSHSRIKKDEKVYPDFRSILRDR